MPAALDLQSEATRQLRAPHPIRHPLFINNPCLWYPSGVRDGNGRPCIMLARENHYQVTLLEFRVGESYRHACVRHVDDPYLEVNPRARLAREERDGGAWDYCEGTAYAFELPRAKKPIEPAAWPFDEQVGQQILALNKQGNDAGQIAGNLHLPNVNKAVIEKFLATNA